MKMKPTMKEIYKKETGKDAWVCVSEEETGLPFYVESLTTDYIKWLEHRSHPCLCDTCHQPKCEGLYATGPFNPNYRVSVCSGYRDSAEETPSE